MNKAELTRQIVDYKRANFGNMKCYGIEYGEQPFCCVCSLQEGCSIISESTKQEDKLLKKALDRTLLTIEEIKAMEQEDKQIIIDVVTGAVATRLEELFNGDPTKHKG